MAKLLSDLFLYHYRCHQLIQELWVLRNNLQNYLRNHTMIRKSKILPCSSDVFFDLCFSIETSRSFVLDLLRLSLSLVRSLSFSESFSESFSLRSDLSDLSSDLVSFSTFLVLLDVSSFLLLLLSSLELVLTRLFLLDLELVFLAFVSA